MSLNYNMQNLVIIRVFLRCQSLLDGTDFSLEPAEDDCFCVKNSAQEK